jgi:hypothetical protein
MASKKPTRTCKLTEIEGHTTLSIVLDHGKRLEVDYYHVKPLASDFGRAVRLVKFTGCREAGQADHYDILVDGEQSSCECKGHQRWGHCKHMDCLRKLVELGRL